MFSLIKDWFIRYELKEDRKLVEYIRDNRRKGFVI